MLNFYVCHGRIVDKIHEIISFEESKWLQKYIYFITQKRDKPKNRFVKDVWNLFNNASYGKTIENVPNRLRLEFI